MTDVAVIGAGAVGLTAALELARRGADVTVLERGPAPGAGCSSGNAGVVGPAYVVPLASAESVRDGLRWMLRPHSPFSLRPRPGTLPWLVWFLVASREARHLPATDVLHSLAAESFSLHRDLHAELDTGLQANGMLCVYETERHFAHARAGADSPDARLTTLDVEEARSLCPSLQGRIAGAILSPGDAHLDPGRYLTAVAAAATAAGASVRFGIEVLGIASRAQGVSVLTTEGELTVDDVVVAAGAWSGQLVRKAGARRAIQGGKGYHLEYEAPESDLSLPVYFTERRIVATPLPGRTRITGMLELAGTDMTVDRSRVNTIARQARERLAGLGSSPPVHLWRGLRPCTPDGLPMIGWVPGAGQVLMATGHGMWGLQLAPVTARLVADLVSGGGNDPRLDCLAPARFSLRPGRRNIVRLSP